MSETGPTEEEIAEALESADHAQNHPDKGTTSWVAGKLAAAYRAKCREVKALEGLVPLTQSMVESMRRPFGKPWDDDSKEWLRTAREILDEVAPREKST